MYRACIFDLDGTLADTLDSLVFSVNKTMKEVGMPQITEDQCRRFVGNGAKVLIEEALKAGGDEELARFEEAFEAYRRIFDANCTYEVKPYSGILAMLRQMKERGMKLGVLSNKPDRQAVHVVAEVFSRELFDAVQGQKEGVPRKPDPTAALTIAEQFGVRPQETLYIGDSEVDAATGKAAGMDTVLVSWGFRPKEVLREASPKWVVDRAEEIMDIIRGAEQ
ncbi:MAG TPA: HAD-IA family hydrolase [Candidatus Mediterraneibacter merdavium]|nr:HAD-IA family hydrolase [Candidatus Mediterraneibacter merdavium]